MARKKLKNRLYLRGDGRYYADVRDLGGGRIALRPPGSNLATQDVDVANHLLTTIVEELMRRRREGVILGVRRPTSLRDMGVKWIAWLKRAENTRASTVKRYELGLRHLFKVLDSAKALDAVTVKDVRDAVAALRGVQSRYGRPLSSATIQRALAAGHLLHKFAVTEGAASARANPWAELDRNHRPKVQHRETDFLEIDEAARLIECCGKIATHTLPLRAIVATYLYTGGRRLEVLGLEVSDIDFARKVVRFRANAYRPLKRGGPRWVRLFPPLAAELQRYIRTSGRVGGLLFPSKAKDGSEAMFSGKVYRHLERAAALAGIREKRVTPQVFRVTYCAARLQSLDEGRPCSKYTVQAEMGHADLSMIDTIYGRLGAADKRHRVEGVEYVEMGRAEGGALVGGGGPDTSSDAAPHTGGSSGVALVV